MRNILIAGLSLFAAACVGGPNVILPPANPSSRTPAPAPQPVRAQPQIMRGFGIDSVIGQPAGALTQRFGRPRIDLAEGDARKLQFVSDRCVLDIFLYPTATAPQPVATHIDARDRSTGDELDRAQCIADVDRAARAP